VNATQRFIVAVPLLVWALSGASCTNYTTPPRTKPIQSAAERNFEAVWDASLDVLRDNYFTVAEQDRREGSIVTAPLTGKQWFEFWRHDAATREGLLESSLDTIYRTAKVQVRPVANDAGRFEAVVTVEEARADKPDVDVSSTSSAYSMFIKPGQLEKASHRREYGLEQETPIPTATPHQNRPIGTNDALAANLAGKINTLAAKKLSQPLTEGNTGVP
jgi:hypothetical protein